MKNTKSEILKIDQLDIQFPIFGGVFQKTISTVHAVKKVNLSLMKGETLGIVGESGSGKSTLGNAILNVLRLTAPDVKISGKVSLLQDNEEIELLHLSRSEMKPFRKHIQMIFQDPYSSLNPRFKVRDIISEPIRLFQKNISSSELKQNLHDLIDIVGMSRQSLDRYPHEFSGGQRQRISIARALASRPRLLICDEPTSALDVSIQAQVLNLLKDIQDELHLTMLFISHDLPVIRQMCNRIIVLKNGIVCETKESEELFNNPEHSYTQELIRLMPKIESII